MVYFVIGLLLGVFITGLVCYLFTIKNTVGELLITKHEQMDYYSLGLYSEKTKNLVDNNFIILYVSRK